MKKFFIVVLFITLGGCAGVDKQPAAIRTLLGPAQQNDVRAQFQLAQLLKAQNQAEDAAFWYRRAADQGHVDAQASLGRMHQDGIGVPQKYAEAAYWFRKAAERGHGESLTNLGYLYSKGLGVEKDPSKALALFLKGAENGVPSSMLQLGLACRRGEGVDKNLKEAFLWLETARQLSRHGSDDELKQTIRDALSEVRRELDRRQLKEAVQLQREWYTAHLGE